MNRDQHNTNEPEPSEPSSFAETLNRLKREIL